MWSLSRVRVHVSASSTLQPRVRRHLASCQDIPARLSNVFKIVLMTLLNSHFKHTHPYIPTRSSLATCSLCFTCAVELYWIERSYKRTRGEEEEVEITSRTR